MGVRLTRFALFVEDLQETLLTGAFWDADHDEFIQVQNSNIFRVPTPIKVVGSYENRPATLPRIKPKPLRPRRQLSSIRARINCDTDDEGKR